MVERLLLVNSTVCGHLLVAWAMGLNAVAWQYGSKAAVFGLVFGALALALSWALSGAVADGSMSAAEADRPRVGLLVLTLASWLCWVLPALFA